MVLSARFVAVLRQLNGVLAGSIGMPWHQFAAANIVGAAAWAGLWTFGPYFFTDLFQKATLTFYQDEINTRDPVSSVISRNHAAEHGEAG